MIFDSQEILEQLDKGLGKDGDLTLIIACTKCDANFELNREAVTLAIGLKTSFIEYLRYVQNSKCPKCNPKNQKENFNG